MDLATLQATTPPTETVFAFYDELAAADLNFMLGRWRGEGLNTGHPLDGVLERFGWFGKAFVDPERVHPLLFKKRGGIRALNPGLMPMNLALRCPWLNNDVVAAMFRVLQPLMATRAPRARLRTVEFRGQCTSAMVYDQLAIIDVFRKVDDKTLLGVMDMKGMEQAFFFVLRRDQS
jgi:hypothetical protein